MTKDFHIYCSCCQNRIKKGSGYKIKDPDIVRKVNTAKSALLGSNQIKKSDTQLDEFIHHKCSLKVNAYIIKNEFVINNFEDNDDQSGFDTYHVNSQNVEKN
jgi:hypothetical protein